MIAAKRVDARLASALIPASKPVQSSRLTNGLSVIIGSDSIRVRSRSGTRSSQIEPAADRLDDLRLGSIELLIVDRRALEDPLRQHLLDQAVEREHLEATVDGLAATLAANAPLSMKATKQIIEAMAAPNAHVAAGAPWYAEVFRSRDFQEGLDAFFTKRKPEFTGE